MTGRSQPPVPAFPGGADTLFWPQLQIPVLTDTQTHTHTHTHMCIIKHNKINPKKNKAITKAKRHVDYRAQNIALPNPVLLSSYPHSTAM